MYSDDLYTHGLSAILSLADDTGILASSRSEMFGCIFGRDSALTGLTLLSAHDRRPDPRIPHIVECIILSLSRLQGRAHNIESGEQPGKCIHEYRPTGHAHLTDPLLTNGNKPWHVYPDSTMRIYDTVDATPLYLILVARFVRAVGRTDILDRVGANVLFALDWLLSDADSNGDGLIDYELHPDRKSGGLAVQSWMDSCESVFFEDSADSPAYPIAPVEAQAYSYAALRLWARHYRRDDLDYSRVLDGRADRLRAVFNRSYPIERDGRRMLAYAIDGAGRALTACRSTMGHVLWASVDGDCIVESPALQRQMVERMMRPDMFVANAGLRTLSAASPHFDAGSYHNGSIWPHDTGTAALGMRRAGFHWQADALMDGLRCAYAHFQTPIELFASRNGKLGEYTHGDGGRACMVQAWSAATMMLFD